MMLQSKKEVGLYLSPGKDARLHITRSWQMGKPVEVAAAWGIDPLFMVVGSQTFPKNVSEYEFLGGIKGEPIPVIKGKPPICFCPQTRNLSLKELSSRIRSEERDPSENSPATTEGPRPVVRSSKSPPSTIETIQY